MRHYAFEPERADDFLGIGILPASSIFGMRVFPSLTLGHREK